MSTTPKSSLSSLFSESKLSHLHILHSRPSLPPPTDQGPNQSHPRGHKDISCRPPSSPKPRGYPSVVLCGAPSPRLLRFQTLRRPRAPFLLRSAVHLRPRPRPSSTAAETNTTSSTSTSTSTSSADFTRDRIRLGRRGGRRGRRGRGAGGRFAPPALPPPTLRSRPRQWRAHGGIGGKRRCGGVAEGFLR